MSGTGEGAVASVQSVRTRSTFVTSKSFSSVECSTTGVITLNTVKQSPKGNSRGNKVQAEGKQVTVKFVVEGVLAAQDPVRGDV